MFCGTFGTLSKYETCQKPTSENSCYCKLIKCDIKLKTQNQRKTQYKGKKVYLNVYYKMTIRMITIW